MPANIVGRVVVGVDGSPGSLAALRYAVEQARRLGRVLVAVIAWKPVGNQVAPHRAPSAQYARLVREFAESQLHRAFDEALGGPPGDVTIESWVTVGPAGPALVHEAGQSHDLLVVGAGRRGRFRHALHAGTARYCLVHARCPVVAVPPPPLQAELGRRLRRRQEISRLLERVDQTWAG